MYLIDTNVISEARKGIRADRGVREFFASVALVGDAIYLSVITVGDLRRGVNLIRHRGDMLQADVLEAWLSTILEQYKENILPLDLESAQPWGRLRVPKSENELDKQVAAIALVNDLTVVTRNTADFTGTGVRLKKPVCDTLIEK